MISKRESLANYLIATVFLLVVLAPAAGMLLAALQPPARAITGAGFPTLLHVENFGRAWEIGNFGRSLRNSAIIAIGVVFLAGTLSILAGYALGVMRFRLANAIFYTFLAGMVLPIEAFIIPLFYDLRTLGVANTYASVILPEAALFLAFGVFWMRAFFRAVPTEVIEAAQVDGASSWQTLWRVLVPIGRPAIVTMALLMGVWSWNEFLIPLIMIRDLERRTAPLSLNFFQGQWTADVSGIAAGALIVAAPLVVIYLFAHRQLIQGVLGGSVRG